MYLNDLLTEKKMTKYRLAKESGIPQTTITDICSRKARIEKCSADTIYKIAKVLDVSMESLIEQEMEDYVQEPKRCSFEVFKSNVCHFVKDNDEFDFIVTTLQEDEISRYWNKKWYPEAFYLLAMVDYLSRMNEIPLCTKYDEIRTHSLKEPLYPRDVMLAAKLNKELDIRERCRREAIPEFLRFNIIESEVRNVY